MADIRQAAEWMQEGKAVKRPVWNSNPRSPNWHLPIRCDSTNRISIQNGNIWHAPELYPDDILADDWEIAE